MPDLFVDPDIAKARTLSTDFYTQPHFFLTAKEKIFSPSWQFIADADQIKEPGQCYPQTLLENYLNEPLLLTQDRKGQMHCLSNVCTHRGNLLVTEACQTTNIRCRYHGRLFQLDGKFISMPEFKQVENFPSEDDNLHELPLFRWGKLLFTSLKRDLTIQEFLKPMIDRLEWLPVDEFIFHPEFSRTYSVNANWALYCENYLEGFHIPFVHADLNAVIDYGNYTTELFKYCNLQLGIARGGEGCFDLPDSSPDFGMNIAAYYFWVFPNLMFNFYPWGLSLNIVKPVSIDKTEVSFHSFVWKKDKMESGAGADLDKVELEDEEVVENVQKGIHSRFYQHGRYSPTREQGTHHFHRLIAEFMNRES